MQHLEALGVYLFTCFTFAPHFSLCAFQQASSLSASILLSVTIATGRRDLALYVLLHKFWTGELVRELDGLNLVSIVREEMYHLKEKPGLVFPNTNPSAAYPLHTGLPKYPCITLKIAVLGLPQWHWNLNSIFLPFARRGLNAWN